MDHRGYFLKWWVIRSVALFLCCFALYSCKVHRSLDLCKPTVCIPSNYENLEEEGTVQLGEWWQEFESGELNCVVDEALKNNLNLKQSWWKLAQACAQARIQGAARFPEITTSPSVLHIRSSAAGLSSLGATGLSGSSTGSTGFGSTTTGTTSSFSSGPFTQYLLSNALSYEIDLWRRVDSKVKASCFEKEATREDLEATALTLSGTVVDLWFTIQEQKTLLEVIDHQVEVSKTQLELIELRFGTGQSSALDVYQQRLQLAQTIAEKPPVQSLLETAQNQMRVLLGGPPDKTDFAVEGGLVELPPFPSLGTPIDLLANRPDLRAQHRRLKSADYEVAAAIADRFPRLNLLEFYDFQAIKVKDLLDEKISLIIGSLLFPVIDGGRRGAEVQRRKAIICELLSGYGQLFLNALLEVEDALVQEKHQIHLLYQLKEEDKVAQSNLRESRWHYINGLNDYLTVIAAIQSSQNLERRMVSEKKQLLLIRSKLYRALGGPYLTCRCL